MCIRDSYTCNLKEYKKIKTKKATVTIATVKPTVRATKPQEMCIRDSNFTEDVPVEDNYELIGDVDIETKTVTNG